MSNPAKDIVNSYPLYPAIFGGSVDNNRNMKISVYGHKALNKPVMVDNDTSFVLGSCSKSMTAAMIIKVCYMKGIPNAMRTITLGSVIPTVMNEYKNVTLRQLLCMTSGIYDAHYVPDMNFWGNFIHNYDDLRTQRALLTEKVCGKNAHKPAFPPGTAYSYSNFGYAIAAHIIETKFNSTYEDLMHQYLFRELGFTAELPTAHATSADGEAIGHAVSGPQPSTYINFWYNGTLKKLDPSLQDPPSVSYKQMKAYVIDTPIQYPPPIGGPFGAIRINMTNWLRYLSAVMMHDPNFLPEKIWKTFLNSGSAATTKHWSPPPKGSPPGTPGKITKSLARYSFGWSYIEGEEEILMYTGYIFTFTTDVFIYQGHAVVAAATNSGRSTAIPTLPLQLLEKNMCPPRATHLIKMIDDSIKQQQKNPGPDPWPHYNGDLTTTKQQVKEQFSTRSGTTHIYIDSPADILSLFLVLILLLAFYRHHR